MLLRHKTHKRMLLFHRLRRALRRYMERNGTHDGVTWGDSLLSRFQAVMQRKGL